MLNSSTNPEDIVDKIKNDYFMKANHAQNIMNQNIYLNQTVYESRAIKYGFSNITNFSVSDGISLEEFITKDENFLNPSSISLMRRCFGINSENIFNSFVGNELKSDWDYKNFNGEVYSKNNKFVHSSSKSLVNQNFSVKDQSNSVFDLNSTESNKVKSSNNSLISSSTNEFKHESPYKSNQKSKKKDFKKHHKSKNNKDKKKHKRKKKEK
jgi:hypothetical protein